MLDSQYFPLIFEYFKCLIIILLSFSGGVKPDKGPRKTKKCSIQWNYRCYNFTIWLRLHRIHVLYIWTLVHVFKLGLPTLLYITFIRFSSETIFWESALLQKNFKIYLYSLSHFWSLSKLIIPHFCIHSVTF